jgi:hypothetical protein
MPTPIIYEIIITDANEQDVNGVYRYDSSFLASPRYYNTKNNNKWLRIMRPAYLGKYSITNNATGGGDIFSAYYITTIPYPFFTLPNNTINFTLGNLGTNPLPTAKGYWRYKNIIGGGGTGKLIGKSFIRKVIINNAQDGGDGIYIRDKDTDIFIGPFDPVSNLYWTINYFPNEGFWFLDRDDSYYRSKDLIHWETNAAFWGDGSAQVFYKP